MDNLQTSDASFSKYNNSNETIRKKRINTASLRDLLKISFDDEEFSILCFDHFRPVHDKFSAGMGHLLKIQLLIEYCERHDKFDKLLALIKEENPKQFNNFHSLYDIPSELMVITSPSSRKRIEVTLNGDISKFTDEVLNAAIGAFAGALNIPRDSVIVIAVRSGSVILRLDVPEEAVSRLITLQKSGDPIIQGLGIKQIKEFPKALPDIELDIPELHQDKRRTLIIVCLILFSIAIIGALIGAIVGTLTGFAGIPVSALAGAILAVIILFVIIFIADRINDKK